jgi:predicted  nucleic acid-binding Zn-ribbon protein
MAEKLSARVERLENLAVLLAEAQIKTEESIRELAQRFRDTDTRMANLSRDLDERIGKLVSAIGELVRRNGSN